MAPSLSLPRFVLFCKATTSATFLCQTNQYIAGSMRCTGDDITSPAIKFELEMAKTDDGDGGSLYNIRSCHNNKYWMAESQDSPYIRAAADKPNEDSSQWSCTLFEAVPVEPDGFGDITIKLRSAHERKLVTVVNGDDDHIHTLYLQYDESFVDEFIVMDAESVLILPKTVVFKASNGKYLQPFPGRITACATDIGGSSIAFCTTYERDGCVSLTLKDNNQTVCFTDDAVMTRDDPPYNSDMFKLIKVAGPKFEDGKVVSSTTIAIRCDANRQFLRCDNARGDNVYADVSSITHDAVFTIEEPVLSRSIYNVKFRLDDSRIYDETIVTMVTKQVSNSNSEPQVEHLTLKYEKKSSSTFDRSVSLSVGVETTFKTGIPFIAEGEIDISVEAEGSMGWSDTTEETQEIETTQDVTVDPMTTVAASIVATKGKCDVPFSYTQKDMLFDGTELLTKMDDGIYRGVSSWNFHCVTNKMPLAL